MRIIIGVTLVINCCCVLAQEIKLPLEVKSGHLYSSWVLADSIEARVMLETGFPKIVISEQFANKNLQGIVEMKEPETNLNISLWGSKNKYPVSKVINDTLMVNGQMKYIDACVVDVSQIKAWKDRDMVCPMRDLTNVLEINIQDSTMVVDKDVSTLVDGYVCYKGGEDERTKGIYINTTLCVRDSLNNKKKLKGDFLLDLGAANVMYLNRNLKKVETFLGKSPKMLLDTCYYHPKPNSGLLIVAPEEIQFSNIVLKGDFIVGMPMSGKSADAFVGMIGNHFYEKFNVVFDFENNDVYLKPNSSDVKILD